MNAAQILLVDDNEDFRRSTVWMLEAAGLQVEDFNRAAGLLARLQQLEDAGVPLSDKCVVTDLRMPDMNGLELMEELRTRRLSVPVVLITGHADVTLAVSAMRMGAANFLEKPFENSILVETVKSAISEPGSALRNPQAAKEKLGRLSPRERQVLTHVCAGKLNKTIADILGISVKTVELHRANMASKLGARNVQDLVRLSLGYE
ncbi:Response regulator [Hahella chejuensis KCTC 2396]|uniref:Response regulator n=1 Tax=Hahella chejuensis (strain KCTC 2396) TaxID=349521 RepID=Q2SBZ4_HAHCH|nr:response regulator [Hahella chejuensis]ABC31830.1 Response regulator [Hahella chejuensis KCTC 2396]